MSEPKQKRKSRAVWWVLTEKDEVLVKHYSGPDKTRAREVTAKLLGKEERVLVGKLSSLAVLSSSSLKASLPRDAF